MKKTILAFSIAGLLVLGGCSKSADTTTPQAASNTPSAPASAAPAGLPSECNDYIEHVKQCIKKLGGSNPAMASMSQQLDQSKDGWAKAGAGAGLAAQCKQMDTQFAQTAKAMGC